MKKNIKIVNFNGGSPFHGPNLRSFYLAKSIMEEYNVELISGSYSHKYKNLPILDDSIKTELVHGIVFNWIKVPRYTTIVGRIFAQFWFGISLLIHCRRLFKGADAIILSCPPPDLIIPTLILKLIMGVPLIVDVRDIWPLTQLEMNKYYKYNPYFHVLRFSEFLIHRGADRIISPLNNYANLYNKKIADKFQFVNNTAELHVNTDLKDEIILKCLNHENGENDLLTLSDLRLDDRVKIIYSGSYDRDNYFEPLLDVAKNCENNGRLVYIFLGDGKYKNDVIEKCMGLKNCYVFEKVESMVVPCVLEACDIGFLGLRNKGIYRYGVSLGKSFEYNACGLPTIAAIQDNILDEAQLNFHWRVDPDDKNGLLTLIRSLKKEEIQEKSDRARDYFERNQSINAMRNRLSEVLQEMQI